MLWDYRTYVFFSCTNLWHISEIPHGARSMEYRMKKYLKYRTIYQFVWSKLCDDVSEISMNCSKTIYYCSLRRVFSFFLRWGRKLRRNENSRKKFLPSFLFIQNTKQNEWQSQPPRKFRFDDYKHFSNQRKILTCSECNVNLDWIPIIKNANYTVNWMER